MCDLLCKILRSCFYKLCCFFEKTLHLSIVVHKSFRCQGFNTTNTCCYTTLRNNLQCCDL